MDAFPLQYPSKMTDILGALGGGRHDFDEPRHGKKLLPTARIRMWPECESVWIPSPWMCVEWKRQQVFRDIEEVFDDSSVCMNCEMSNSKSCIDNDEVLSSWLGNENVHITLSEEVERKDVSWKFRIVIHTYSHYWKNNRRRKPQQRTRKTTSG